MDSSASPRNWRKRSRPRSAMRKPPPPSPINVLAERRCLPGRHGSSRLLAGFRTIFRMGTADEYIHEPSGALGPIRTRGNVGNTDQSPEQIEGLQIRPDVAVRDRPLHQRINRSPNRSAGTLIELRFAANR